MVVSSHIPVHEEQQSSVGLMLGLYAGMVIIGATALAASHAPAESLWAVIAVLAIFPLVIWGFSRFSVVITSDELCFGYPIFKRRFPLSVVTVGDIVKIPFWYGWGIHWIFGRWVWNARIGRGLQIKARKTTYILGSDHPEQLQAALLRAVTPGRHA